jgi:hypothetical protein
MPLRPPTPRLILCRQREPRTIAHRRACSLGEARAQTNDQPPHAPAALPAGARHRARARTEGAPRKSTRTATARLVGGALALLVSPSRLPGRPALPVTSRALAICDRHGHVGRQPGAWSGTTAPPGPAAPRAEHDARVPRGAVRALPDTAAARPRAVEPGPGTARAGDQRLHAARAAKHGQGRRNEAELASCGAGTLLACCCGPPGCVCVHAHGVRDSGLQQREPVSPREVPTRPLVALRGRLSLTPSPESGSTVAASMDHGKRQ